MRSSVLVLCLLLVACSESTAPPGFTPQPGTYTFSLSACDDCDTEEASAFALRWKDGFQATLQVTDVSQTAVQAEFLTLEAADGSDLLAALIPKEIRFRQIASGGFRGSTSYVLGEIFLTLETDDTCAFSLSYPSVGRHPGLCELVFEAPAGAP